MFTKNWKCLAVLCALTPSLTAVEAQAALVNFDINAARSYDGGGVATSWSATFTGAAVVGTGTQTWNALNRPNNSNPSTGSLTTGLKDSTGAPTAVTLPAFQLPGGDFRDSVIGGPGSSLNAAPAVPGSDNGYNLLMGDRPQGGGTASVTISGLAAGAWDLYIFGFGDGNGLSGWNVKDGTAATQSSGWTTFGPDLINPSSLVLGTHYLHFSGTHIAATDILVSSSQIGGEGTNYGQVRWTGFQINQADAVIPEPSTLVLAGLGLLGLLICGRQTNRRRT